MRSICANVMCIGAFEMHLRSASSAAMQMAHRVKMSYPVSRMEPTREDIRKWLETALQQTGETPSGLARRAGLATTTLTRFLNDPSSPMLTLRSLAKIAHVAAIQPLGLPSGGHGNQARGTSLQEGEAERYDWRGSQLEAVIAALIGKAEAADPWVMRGIALEAAGLLAGDLVIVDLNEKPRSGDTVCAQAYQWEAGRAETIFRIYEPPYLIAAPAGPPIDPGLRKPILVDNDRVIIRGVVIASLRSRQPA